MTTKLKTWADKSDFEYDGSVIQDVEIRYGAKRRWREKVSKAEFRTLLSYFKGKTVDIGTSRTNPPPGSLGEWLQRHVTQTAIASYIGPILIREGYAERVSGQPSKIQFL